MNPIDQFTPKEPILFNPTDLLAPEYIEQSDGIALGFITFTAVKLLSGKFSEITLAVWILTIILLAKIMFL